MKTRSFPVRSTLTLLLLAALLAGLVRAEEEKQKSPPLDKAALERTRQTVQMLDDIYKSAVVSITKKYADKQSDTPAAEVAKEVFAAIHKKGWHKARLIDATGKPKNKKNLPETAFEKSAAKAMKDGKTYLEEVGEVDGKPVFRAATVVPSVMQQCATCHGGKEGRVLGAIVYELPIK